MKKIHLLLVSREPLPNLTPLLDPDIKPDMAILLVSDDMQQRAQWLQDVARSNGMQTRSLAIDNPWDIQQLQQQVAELIVEYADSELVLNATGGTKPMSIAAYEEFRSQGLPVYYVHPGSDCIVWMHDKELPVQRISNQLRLEPFLLAHGARVIDIQRNRPRVRDVELADKIIDDIRHYGHAVSEINHLAYSAANGALQSQKISDLRSANAEALRDLIDFFEINGLLRETNDRLVFADETSRHYVNGLWLESWLYQQVLAVADKTADIHDQAAGLVLDRQLERGKPVRNELDVAFLYRNRLHLIECKTRRMKSGGSVGTDPLYKLKAIKPIMGGLKARAMLVSLLPVPDHDKTRAAEMGISVLDATQLKNISGHIKSFMS